MENKKIEPYLPIYHRPPNKFVRYEIVDFDHGNGDSGKYRIAHFLDKKGKAETMVAQVMWGYIWGKPWMANEYFETEKFLYTFKRTRDKIIAETLYNSRMDMYDPDLKNYDKLLGLTGIQFKKFNRYKK